MDQYATHLPLLTYIASQFQGPYLELGAGHYSTPVLSRFGHLTSLESDIQFERHLHLDHEVERMQLPDIFFSRTRSYFELILIDCAPAAMRKVWLDYLLDPVNVTKWRIIILHDFNIEFEHLYRYREAIKNSKVPISVCVHNQFYPSTALLSMGSLKSFFNNRFSYDYDRHIQHYAPDAAIP